MTMSHKELTKEIVQIIPTSGIRCTYLAKYEGVAPIVHVGGSNTNATIVLDAGVLVSGTEKIPRPGE